MSFKPSLRDLELIAIMANARAPTDAIAAAVGLAPAVFRQWLCRMTEAKLAGEVETEPVVMSADQNFGSMGAFERMHPWR